jgi:LysM repeat protein
LAAPGTSPAAGSSAAAAAGLFRAYRVQPGDTVRFVAQMFGVSPASVAQASGLQNADQLRIGQVLTVPSQPGWLYRVQSGETLDQIAARTGVPSALIASTSKLTVDAVQPGDVILIPDQSSARGK